MSKINERKMVMELDVAELAVILIEIITEKVRPEGMTAKAALMDAELQNPELHDRFVDAATAAIHYFIKKMQGAQEVS